MPREIFVTIFPWLAGLCLIPIPSTRESKWMQAEDSTMQGRTNSNYGSWFGAVPFAIMFSAL